MTPFVIADIQGTQLSDDDRDILKHPGLAGIILFAKNYQNPQQLTGLCADIHSVNPRALISVDQEGGRVQRFETGFVNVASMRDIGVLAQSQLEQAQQQLYADVHLMAKQLRGCGMNMTYAPVLDLDDQQSQVIGERAFAKNAQAVIPLARGYINALHDGGLPAIGKHFPGHGGVSEDSHYELPVDRRSYASICEQGLLPFISLASELDAMMSAHIIFPEVDNLPATFSRVWLRDILRQQIGFEGVVFSDDLTMKATSRYGSMQQRAQLALEAGCDMVLCCHNRQHVWQLLNTINYTDATRDQRVEQFITSWGGC